MESRSVNDYTKLEQIGMGTYGIVYKARHKTTGKIYALKQIKMSAREVEGFPITSLREISILKQISHPNVVKLEDVVVGQSSIFLAFEYCRIDLANMVDTMVSNRCTYFSIAEVKCLVI